MSKVNLKELKEDLGAIKESETLVLIEALEITIEALTRINKDLSGGFPQGIAVEMAKVYSETGLKRIKELVEL